MSEAADPNNEQIGLILIPEISKNNTEADRVIIDYILAYI